MALAARIHAFLNALGRPDEAAEVRRLEREVARLLADLDTDPWTVAAVVAEEVAPPPLAEPLTVLLARLIAAEGLLAPPAPDPDAPPTTAELWELRRRLRLQKRLLTELDETLGLLEALARAVLPAVPAGSGPALFTTPLYARIGDFPAYLDLLVQLPLDRDVHPTGLLERLADRVHANLVAIDPKQPRLPSRYGTSDPAALIDTYLAGTPFPDFLATPVPLPVTQDTLFAHMHVVGGSNAGKTQLLQSLILHHLDQDDPPALVVVDSQGELIPKLARLARFAPDAGDLADRLILISPRDITHPPAINVFDVRNERLARYDAATREQVVAGVIDTFDYLFSGLVGADLTAKQSVFFRFIARLLIALPETLGRNATILDMIALMDDPTPYLEVIAALPPIQRRFFERDFPGRTFAQTREQIRYRLNAILENPTLERLFTAPETRLDLHAELDRGAIILVDTDQSFLKGASGHYGRIFIALVLQAVLERAAVPEARRRPAFLIVDEAADYFDSNIDHLLTEARKYKLGCVFAHQYLDQCSSDLRASFAANTSIKLAAGVSMGDARALAPDLRTTPHFILSQPRGHFALHVRNVTAQAVSVPVEFGALERRPRMSEAAFRTVRERNRARVSLAPSGGSTAAPAAMSRDEDTGRAPAARPAPPPPADRDNPGTEPSETL